MPATQKVAVLIGSLRKESFSRKVANALIAIGQPPLEFEIVEIGHLPFFNQDFEADLPPVIRAFKEKIASFDAVLFVTPEYNRGVPGVLKNAIDWVSRPRASTPFQNKPAAVIGASTGQFGAVWAQAELRKVLGSTGARVVDLDLPLAKAHEAFDEDDALTSAQHHVRLDEVIEALVEAIEERNGFLAPIAA
jgi:chromate reductase, NAD(P)H dehydrogenase (quinone)